MLVKIPRGCSISNSEWCTLCIDCLVRENLLDQWLCIVYDGHLNSTVSPKNPPEHHAKKIQSVICARGCPGNSGSVCWVFEIQSSLLCTVRSPHVLWSRRNSNSSICGFSSCNRAKSLLQKSTAHRVFHLQDWQTSPTSCISKTIQLFADRKTKRAKYSEYHPTSSPPPCTLLCPRSQSLAGGDSAEPRACGQLFNLEAVVFKDPEGCLSIRTMTFRNALSHSWISENAPAAISTDKSTPDSRKQHRKSGGAHCADLVVRKKQHAVRTVRLLFAEITLAAQNSSLAPKGWVPLLIEPIKRIYGSSLERRSVRKNRDGLICKERFLRKSTGEFVNRRQDSDNK